MNSCSKQFVLKQEFYSEKTCRYDTMRHSHAAQRGPFEHGLRNATETAAQAIIAMADKNFMISDQEAAKVSYWVRHLYDVVASGALLHAQSEASIE